MKLGALQFPNTVLHALSALRARTFRQLLFCEPKSFCPNARSSGPWVRLQTVLTA